MFRAIKAALAAVALAGLPSLMFAASPAEAAGKSANAHMCQRGGWMALLTSTGTTFKNQGSCVSYGAHGGHYQQPVTNCWRSSNPNYPFDLQLVGAINTRYNARVDGSTDGTCNFSLGGGQQTLVSAVDQTTANAECTAINGMATVANNAQVFGYLTAPANYWGCGPNF